jgi:DNA end-binding protein Ku
MPAGWIGRTFATAAKHPSAALRQSTAARNALAVRSVQLLSGMGVHLGVRGCTRVAMAPRAGWKGFLVMLRVGCPVRLHPAVSRSERLGFQALNRATLNRLHMRPHDPQTGKEVTRDAIVRGYEVEPGQFVLIEDRELAELQIESSRSLVLERFIERGGIDPAYFDTPHFLLPDGRGADVVYSVLREAMHRRRLAGVSRIVLGGRERAAIIEPRGSGMLLTTLRAAHEVRSDESYFAEIDPAPPEEALVEQAERLVARLAGAFDPRRDFRDRYQEALFHFVQAKRRGEKPMPPRPMPPAFVLDLEEALEESLVAVSSVQRDPLAPSRAPSRRLAKQPARN